MILKNKSIEKLIAFIKSEYLGNEKYYCFAISEMDFNCNQ